MRCAYVTGGVLVPQVERGDDATAPGQRLVELPLPLRHVEDARSHEARHDEVRERGRSDACPPYAASSTRAGRQVRPHAPARQLQAPVQTVAGTLSMIEPSVARRLQRQVRLRARHQRPESRSYPAAAFMLNVRAPRRWASCAWCPSARPPAGTTMPPPRPSRCAAVCLRVAHQPLVALNHKCRTMSHRAKLQRVVLCHMSARWTGRLSRASGRLRPRRTPPRARRCTSHDHVRAANGGALRVRGELLQLRLPRRMLPPTRSELLPAGPQLLLEGRQELLRDVVVGPCV